MRRRERVVCENLQQLTRPRENKPVEKNKRTSNNMANKR